MTKNLDEVRIQVHLAEFTALRDEILALMKWRDNLLFISLSISGAIFAFVFNKESNDALTPDTALYLLPILSSIMFCLWVLNTLRTARIGFYIKDVLAVKLNNLLSLSSTKDKLEKQISVLGWEGSKYRLQFKTVRRLVEIFTYLLTFVLTGVLAQTLLLNNITGHGQGYERIFHLKYPKLFVFNCFVLYLTCYVFTYYLLKGITKPHLPHKLL